jgi:hypothetical protein
MLEATIRWFGTGFIRQDTERFGGHYFITLVACQRPMNFDPSYNSTASSTEKWFLYCFENIIVNLLHPKLLGKNLLISFAFSRISYCQRISLRRNRKNGSVAGHRNALRSSTLDGAM